MAKQPFENWFCTLKIPAVIKSVLWIRNALFRIRIQLQIFRVPDPFLSILLKHIEKRKKLKINQKKSLPFTKYLPFSISHYSPAVYSPESTDRIRIYNTGINELCIMQAGCEAVCPRVQPLLQPGQRVPRPLIQHRDHSHIQVIF